MCVKGTSPPDIRKTVLNLITKNKITAQTYLDLGCGTGEFTLKVAKLVGAKEIYGVDKSDEFLKNMPPSIRFIRRDLLKESLPFPAGYFDFVTAIEVIEHLPFGDNLIREAYRVLKPKGYFLITTPNLASWINRLLILLGYQPMHHEPSENYHIGIPFGVRKKNVYSGHVCLYTLRSLCDLLNIYGFIVKDKMGSSWQTRFKIVNILDRIFSKSPQMAQSIAILAFKP